MIYASKNKKDKGGTTQQLQNDQPSSRVSVRIGFQATNHRTIIRPDDGRQLSRLRKCAYARKNDEKQLKFKEENFRDSILWIKSGFPSAITYVNLMRRISTNL